MITKEQLIRIAKFNGINPYYQEKEYLQKIFLRELFRKEREFIFKGGTCLKICYKHQRYSEDLDFDFKGGGTTIKGKVKRALAALEFVGIEYEIIKSEVFDRAYTCKIRFKGPLYTGSMHSSNTIQIDAGDRGKIFLEPAVINVISEYPDINNFLVVAMRKEEIFTEKIIALYKRKTSRDLFDVWSLTTSGTELDYNLLEKKMEENNVKPTDKPKFVSKREFEEDLRNLLPTLPKYEQLLTDIERILVQKG